MSRFLFRVERAEVIEGRGIVLLPGLPAQELLHGATELLLRLPNGTNVIARLAGMAHFGRKQGAASPLLIARSPPDLVVPAATEVWTA